MADYSGYTIKRAHSLTPLTSVHEAVAADGRPGRFALKIFHPPASTKVRRFYAIEGWLLAAERQQQGAKKDGTVVEVLAFGRCAEGAFAVMPWQEHFLEPLIKTLGAKGDTLRVLAECLLNTVEQWAAQTGGPHGNLKPANIFLSRSGPLAGMTARLSDPAFLPGEKIEARHQADLAAVGAMLAQIVRRRPPGAWPIEEAPEWKALGNGGKGWLAFCNYLLNPSPKEGELTIAEARRHLRKVPKDANPVKMAMLTMAALLVLGLGAVVGFARFGNPIYMPDQVFRLAVKVGNPQIKPEVPAAWAQLCVAWDTWLVDLQSNGPRLLKTEGLWEQNDQLRAELAEFVATSNQLLPATLVPEAINEKRLGVLAISPPPAVLNELQLPSISGRVTEAGRRLNRLSLNLETWARWNQLRSLQKLMEEGGFSRPAQALQTKLPPERGTQKIDLARTLKFFNDLSLDDTGTLLLAQSWSEITQLRDAMEKSTDRIQIEMPREILKRLTDKPSIADFAASLADPLDEMRQLRKHFLDPQVVRERFLKESPLQTETTVVTAADFPRWKEGLMDFHLVLPAEDPRLAAELTAIGPRLAQGTAELEPDAPAAEPGGLPTLTQAEFQQELTGLNTDLRSLRERPIVRRDLPAINEETGKMAGAFRLLEQRLEVTLTLLKPEIWLSKVAQAYGKFTESKQRWAAWQQAALTGVTPPQLSADRTRFRQLRANQRQVKEWIDGLEGSAGFDALGRPDLAAASSATATELQRLETVRRELAATAVANAAEWRNALPVTPWAAASVAVRAPLEAHRDWLAALPGFAANLDKLNELLVAGFGWTEGVREVVDLLAARPGVGDLTGRPAEWNIEAKQLARLVDASDRSVLTAAAQSGGLSRKLMAWRRLGTLATWPTGAEDFDLDTGVVTVMREVIGRDVQDAPRRNSLLEEMVKETRLRFNRAARAAARLEAQLTAMFERMQPAGLTDGDLDAPVAYNLALWRLKRTDWNESNLDHLRVRRDAFVGSVRAIPGIPAQPAVRGLLEEISSIELKDDPNRAPTPSPRLAGWQEELTNEGLALTATWTGGGKKVQLEYAIVQPTDGTLPFYLARREIAAGEFVDLLNARTKPAAAVLAELPKWATAETPDKPWNKPISWRPRSDNKGFEVNPSWIYSPTALVAGILDNTDLRAATPALEQMLSENPTARSPVQLVPPEAARIFAEQVLGARLPRLAEWRAVTQQLGKPTDGYFRGPRFQATSNAFETFKEGGQTIDWRPKEGAFLPMVSVPGTAARRKFTDDGQLATQTDKGKLWFAPVDEGPSTGGFINLFGNVWIYLTDGGKDFYVAGGSALSHPGVDITEPHKVEAASVIGATKVREGFTDVGIRPAFDAPPGFRERYKLLVLVRGQKYLTL